MAGERKAFLLRVDPALWRELEAWAAAELRSVNGQVEFLLREAVRRRRGPSPPPDDGAALAGAAAPPDSPEAP